jgi:hypothetical protein
MKSPTGFCGWWGFSDWKFSSAALGKQFASFAAMGRVAILTDPAKTGRIT